MLDLSKVNHHPAMQELVDILCSQTDQPDRGFFQAEVAYYFGKIASAMRASIVTKDRGTIPVNIYTLALATSGFGKGHSVGVLETEILSGFKNRFMENTFPVIAEQHLWVLANRRAARSGTDPNDEFEGAKKEWRMAGQYTFDFDSATTAAVKQLRDKLLMSDIGSINLQIDEIGSNLIGSVEVLNVGLELYDKGLIKTKLTKNTAENTRVEQLDGPTPTNMLLFGTPARLLDGGNTEDQFWSFLETGYARRCIFGHGEDKRSHAGFTAEELYNRKIDPKNRAAIERWYGHFTQLAEPALYNWQMSVADDVGIELLDYRLSCERLAKLLPEHEEVKKAELSHRYFKALKLAGAYAFIDASTEVEIGHLRSAIKLVEESGQSFFKILSRDKAYQKLAKYVANCGTEVTHADLVESLPFYPKSNGPRQDMMNLATAWGYKNHIVIKKQFTDGIEFYKGETLKETDLSKCRVSYSQHFAYEYAFDEVPFEQLHQLTQAPGYHFINHQVKNGHRCEENIVPGFNLLVIDVDGGTPLELAHTLLADYRFMTYTTKRHQTEGHGDRFRILLPTNYVLELDAGEYKELVNSVLASLPFPEKTDESTNQRSKKWQSCETGTYHYNDGELFDILPFIPKTARNEKHREQAKALQSLDNLERWFAQRIGGEGSGRNNQMIKYALLLVDSGMDLPSVLSQVKHFNAQLPEPMTEQEIDTSIAVTVAKRYQEAA